MIDSYPPALEAAIRELAEQNAELNHCQPITAREASHFIDVDVLAAYWTVQRANNEAGEAESEILHRLTSAQRVRFHTELVTDASPDSLTAWQFLRAAMVEHVTDWLVEEATTYQGEHELAYDPVNDRLFDDPFGRASLEIAAACHADRKASRR